MGWYEARDRDAKQAVLDYLGNPPDPMPWPFIRAAFASVSGLAIVPMQDILALGSEHRMNTPGSNRTSWARDASGRTWLAWGASMTARGTTRT